MVSLHYHKQLTLYKLLSNSIIRVLFTKKKCFMVIGIPPKRRDSLFLLAVQAKTILTEQVLVLAVQSFSRRILAFLIIAFWDYPSVYNIKVGS